MSKQAVEGTDLDALPVLPTRNRVSVVLLLLLTGLNAFNDNILKMLLVGLAPKVVEGSLGRDIGLWLGAIILLPYILFAPLAGFLSDRFSKRQVILAMLLAQSVILLLTGLMFHLALGRLSVLLALGMFFLLAVQSTLFSPAKMGILKELAGSRRLGMVAGALQMVTMLGILSGLSLGGPWFDRLFGRGMTAWQAASWPVWTLFGVSMVALALGWLLQRTRPHAQAAFTASVMWEHFANLRETLAHYGLRRACVGVAVYWFVASMVGAMFVDLGLSLHPGKDAEGAATEASYMTLKVGLGTILGSLIVAVFSRRGVQLGMVPFGALGMAAGLLGCGWWAAGLPAFDLSLMLLGLSGACYMVPVQAYIQDRAEPARRGRVLASMNLLDSLAGMVAVAFLFGLKYGLGASFKTQFWALAVLMLVASVYIVRLLPQDMVRFLGRLIVRLIYRVRSHHVHRVPPHGGVLMLPNHVSYVDAMVLSTACERPVRFVIWETLYKQRCFNGVLRLFGTVPISPTRAKDAVRSVVQALRDGEVVCLFPEGQITRHGMINELRKGFELMARQAGCPVQPVYLDGLWGSIFSFQGGQCFTKWPKKLRYPVAVHFGEIIPAREAGTVIVRQRLEELGNEAFLGRQAFERHSGDVQTLANALRLGEVEWHHQDESLWICDAQADAVAAASVRRYAELHRGVRIMDRLEEGGQKPSSKVVAIGTAKVLQQAAASVGWQARVRRAVCLVEGTAGREDLPTALGVPLFVALLIPQKGVWLSLNVPDPMMPPEQEGAQTGQRKGSLGRLLPGFVTRSIPEGGLLISGFSPGCTDAWSCRSCELTPDGFLILKDAPGSTAAS